MIKETITSKQKGGIGIVPCRVGHSQRSSSWDVVSGAGIKVAFVVVFPLNFISGIMVELKWMARQNQPATISR